MGISDGGMGGVLRRTEPLVALGQPNGVFGRCVLEPVFHETVFHPRGFLFWFGPAGIIRHLLQSGVCISNVVSHAWEAVNETV